MSGSVSEMARVECESTLEGTTFEMGGLRVEVLAPYSAPTPFECSLIEVTTPGDWKHVLNVPTALLRSHLALEARKSCWHCKVTLLPSIEDEHPRCESCPSFDGGCDRADCPEGCEERE